MKIRNLQAAVELSKKLHNINEFIDELDEHLSNGQLVGSIITFHNTSSGHKNIDILNDAQLSSIIYETVSSYYSELKESIIEEIKEL